MKSRRPIVMIASTALLGGLIVGCSAAEPEAQQPDGDCVPTYEFPTITEGQLTLAAPDYPPFVYEEEGQVTGFDGDFLTQFAADSCLTLELNQLPSAGVVETVTNGQADVAAGGWWPTPARLEVVGMSDEMIRNPPVFVSEEPSAVLADYEGQRLGTVQSWLWAEDIKEWGGDDVTLYETPQAVLADLTAGRLDVALLSVASASWSLTEDQYADLSFVIAEPDPEIDAFNASFASGIPFVQSATELGDALNQALADYSESGQLETMATDNGFDASLLVEPAN